MRYEKWCCAFSSWHWDWTDTFWAVWNTIPQVPCQLCTVVNGYRKIWDNPAQTSPVYFPRWPPCSFNSVQEIVHLPFQRVIYSTQEHSRLPMAKVYTVTSYKSASYDQKLGTLPPLQMGPLGQTAQNHNLHPKLSVELFISRHIFIFQQQPLLIRLDDCLPKHTHLPRFFRSLSWASWSGDIKTNSTSKCDVFSSLHLFWTHV